MSSERPESASKASPPRVEPVVTEAMLEAGEEVLRDPDYEGYGGARAEWLDSFDWAGKSTLPDMIRRLYLAMHSASLRL